MKAFTSAAVAVASTMLFSSVAAQQTYQIDPNSVSNTTRGVWCTNQIAQCPLICLQTAGNSAATLANTCMPADLTFACVCSNGMSPNLTEYTQTIPYYICTEWGNQCVSNCNGDNQCSSDCRSQHLCGAQSPVRANTSTISTMLSTSSTGVPAGATTGTDGATVYTGFAGASSTGSSDGGSSSGSDSGAAASTGAAASPSAGGAMSLRAAALNAGQTFGLLGVVGAMVGGFAVLL